MSNKRNSYFAEAPNGSVTGDTQYGLHPDLVGPSLTDIPVRSSSSPGQTSGLQPSLNYIHVHPESTGSFLAPEDYLSDPRASPVSEAVGSLYAWSSASEAEMLRPSASIDSSVRATASSPFMQPYFNFDSSMSAMENQIPGSSGYTSQQINQWCMEAHNNESFNHNHNHHHHNHHASSYNAVNQLPSYPTPPMSQTPFQPLSDGMSPAPEWFNLPVASLQRSVPSHDGYLSPPSVPAVSIDSHSVMSTSPTPTTLSSFDSNIQGQPPSPPSNPADLTRYGIPTVDGAWRCAHPGCTSQALFRRGCDLRKHFNRHRKHLFCRYEGCPQSRQGGFSSKKDRARHEAKHNPGIVCEWDGCGRVFSRVDNMKDHVRRIHRRGVSD
ncbi:hypothetical protein N7478_004008 [Penicillium angulare]|uniref:uncharacterized protein n=1 Tax=Penicillium angulare TaxID=116970 RepID=UPI00253FD239|nr:uncharacterized protein N7478_004008 [Penicillium angulare]KAJ5278636.1 hypothetical protein N7478_004008 [Penicillium angulare]